MPTGLRFHKSTVTPIITTWVNFMFHKFKEIPIWYPRTRCIIDATKIFIQMPSNPSAQQLSLTFSNYKNHITLKASVGSSHLELCLLFHLYGGNISIKKLTVECRILLKKLEPSDSVMADQGFNIEDILPPGVS